MNKTIIHEFIFNHPPAVVWNYLTDSKLLAQCLMPNDIQPVLGRRFKLQSKPMPRFGFDGVVYCEILELVENQKLVYSWKGGILDTVVTWTLRETENGTILRLEHAGFRGLKALLPYFIMNNGWAKIGKRLAGLLST